MLPQSITNVGLNYPFASESDIMSWPHQGLHNWGWIKLSNIIAQWYQPINTIYGAYPVSSWTLVNLCLTKFICWWSRQRKSLDNTDSVCTGLLDWTWTPIWPHKCLGSGPSSIIVVLPQASDVFMIEMVVTLPYTGRLSLIINMSCFLIITCPTISVILVTLTQLIPLQWTSRVFNKLKIFSSC